MIAHSPAGTLSGRQDKGRDRRRFRAALGAGGVRGRAVFLHVKRHEAARIRGVSRRNALEMQQASMTIDADDRSDFREGFSKSVLCERIEYYRGSVPPTGSRYLRKQSRWRCEANAAAPFDGTATLCQEKAVSSEAEILGHLDDRDRNTDCHVAVRIFSRNNDWRGLANISDPRCDFSRAGMGGSRRTEHLEIAVLRIRESKIHGARPHRRCLSFDYVPVQAQPN